MNASAPTGASDAGSETHPDTTRGEAVAEAADAGEARPAPETPDTSNDAVAEASAEAPQGASGDELAPAAPAPPDAEPAFRDLGLPPALLAALDRVGYETPSPIQAQTIPHLLAGHDLLGHAPTGTGKTAAFTLPLLARLDVGRRVPQALVLTPTRELAIQVAEACRRYAAELKDFHVLPIYGGQDYRIQLRQLERGVHVVVGTPGRVMDHIRRGTLDLDALEVLVLDEADEMLRMGFIDDVEWILEQTPPARQVALFSATLPAAIQRIAQSYLNEPVEVSIAARTATAETIRQRWWLVSGLHKLDALTRILEVEPFDALLIFVRTKTATIELAERLEARGYAAAALNGDLPQKLREQIVEHLKQGQLDIIVATDVAARGLDVERVSHVINYDIPYDTEAYIHRIGRTGRAGRAGEAILFVAPRERRMLRAIEQATRQPIDPLKLPSTEAVNDKRIADFKQRITDALAAGELDFLQGLVEQYQQEHDVPAAEIAAALARLVIGEQPLLLPPEPERPPRREQRDRRGEQGRDRDRPRYRDRPQGRGERDFGDPRRRDGRGRDDDRGAPRRERRDDRPERGWPQGERPERQRWGRHDAGGGYSRDRRDDRPRDHREPAYRRPAEEAPAQSVERDLPPAHSARDDAAAVPVRVRAQERPERDARRRDDRRDDRRDSGRDDRRGPGDERRFERGERRFGDRDRDHDRARDRDLDREQPERREHRGPPAEGMERFRIEVGHDDGVKPGNIVGAIANEAGLEGRHIGRIDIRDDHTTLDLPAGMPKEIFQHLKKTRVCGRPLAIKRIGGKPPRDRNS
ncbi:MAG: DEAD/DEAH box helicase [Thiohalocapsa sp.]|uniref:DEAD/DEAH box helicase n=1 Tax=Thiohalocapsa sp. TaxID=2497641 RepID=UPI0025EE3D4C|nr:DEAD/DEAH box helicase [Thiohalocapsa sp.]MCG6942086.1 DEAD/DEAH box helicase [Thiohalocapsa sp.]